MCGFELNDDNIELTSAERLMESDTVAEGWKTAALSIEVKFVACVGMKEGDAVETGVADMTSAGAWRCKFVK